MLAYLLSPYHALEITRAMLSNHGKNGWKITSGRLCADLPLVILYSLTQYRRSTHSTVQNEKDLGVCLSKDL